MKPDIDAANEAAIEAAIEKARRAQKICAHCGPRIEPDAIYCSSCGRKLNATGHG